MEKIIEEKQSIRFQDLNSQDYFIFEDINNIFLVNHTVCCKIDNSDTDGIIGFFNYKQKKLFNLWKMGWGRNWLILFFLILKN